MTQFLNSYLKMTQFLNSTLIMTQYQNIYLFIVWEPFWSVDDEVPQLDVLTAAVKRVPCQPHVL